MELRSLSMRPDDLFWFVRVMAPRNITYPEHDGACFREVVIPWDAVAQAQLNGYGGA